MYAASSFFNSAIAAGSRQLNIKANIGVDTYLNDSIVSLYFEDTICPDDFFEVGTVSAAYIEITLLNVTGNFDGLIVTPQIGVYTSQGSFEYVPLGVFIVEETVKNRGSLTLKCFDKTVMLEQSYSTSIAWPNTITNVMNEICGKVGVTFTGTLPDYTVSFPNGAATYREVVSRIAGICGGFAKFDRSGNLTIKNYAVTPTIQRTITADNYFDLNKEDTPYTIGKVTIKDDTTNVSYSNGALSSSTMELIIDNTWATEAIASDLYNKLNGLSYMPLTMNWQGDPSLDVGDWVTVSDIYGKLDTLDGLSFFPVTMSWESDSALTSDSPINTILTSVKYNFAGGLSSDFESIGEGKTKNQFNTNPTNIPKPGDSVQTNIPYNGVTIDNENGITIDSEFNTVNFNATDGLKVIRNNDGALILYLDSSGNVIFSGKLNGASGTFSGDVSGGTITADGLSGKFLYSNALDVNPNTGGVHVYIRPKSGGELRATLTGTTDTYVPVRASSFPTGSMADYKQDIAEWDESALDLINSATVYQYRLKSEFAEGVDRVRQGLVIGEGYNIPAGVIDGDGVEQYLMNSWSWKAIQELSKKNADLEERLEALESQINTQNPEEPLS